ncbi:MAG: VOC family protein [Cyanobacteria bacterium P01_D01_bin.105]
MVNHFIWADLSTFDTKIAKSFYSQCFGWTYQALDDEYLICESDRQSVAGLYHMPEKFQKIGMPSFWMPYIHVADIHETVRIAEQCGGKVEVVPEPAPGGGVIALIRDPVGAGFTCYQGKHLSSLVGALLPGHMTWNELHISNLSKVNTFYSTVFGWSIQPTDRSDRYEIFAGLGDPIAGITVTNNDIKGDKEYWGVYFAVNNLPTALKCIEHAGGQIIAEQLLGTQTAFLAFDSQHAAFYVLENIPSASVQRAQHKSSDFKWRSISGLLIVALAILLEANWVWSILFLLWIIPDIKNGSTYFFEHVERRHNPLIYWLIITTWIGLSLYLLFS